MNKHILVIDDNAQMRSMLQVVLESEAYVVDTASDGLIVLDKIVHQQAMPEIILLDLHMPRMNGLQLIEALRQHEEGTQWGCGRAATGQQAGYSPLPGQAI